MISQRISRHSLILSKNILSRNYGTKYTARLYGIRDPLVTVFYDGKCGLCSREINHYKKIAPNGKYQICQCKNQVSINYLRHYTNYVLCMYLQRLKATQWRIQHGCYGCFSTRNIGAIYSCHRPLAPAILGQSITVSTRNSPCSKYTRAFLYWAV